MGIEVRDRNILPYAKGLKELVARLDVRPATEEDPLTCRLRTEDGTQYELVDILSAVVDLVIQDDHCAHCGKSYDESIEHIRHR